MLPPRGTLCLGIASVYLSITIVKNASSHLSKFNPCVFLQVCIQGQSTWSQCRPSKEQQRGRCRLSPVPQVSVNTSAFTSCLNVTEAIISKHRMCSAFWQQNAAMQKLRNGDWGCAAGCVSMWLKWTLKDDRSATCGSERQKQKLRYPYST